MPIDTRGVYISPNVEDFFINQLDVHNTAPTFDDVTFSNWPADLSGVNPADANIETFLTPSIKMSLPFISSPMDSVTGSKMAIEMAKLGGIGILHVNLSDEEVKDQVHEVRHHLSAFIDQPIVVSTADVITPLTPDSSMQDIEKFMNKKHFSFRTMPVLDGKGAVIGLLTTDRFRLTANKKKTAREVMVQKDDLVIVAKQFKNPTEAYKLMQSKDTKHVLVEDTTGLKGLYVLSDVERIVQGESARYNVDESGRLMVSIAVQSDPKTAIPRIRLVQNHLKVVLVDSAKGGSPYVRDTVKAIKKEFPGMQVIAGNVSGAEEARMLAEAGADSLRVGQGGGSICTTRERTGIGTPQLTAVWQAARAVKDMKKPPTIIADGGIRYEKDIALALAVGADTVMMGSKLAGADEAPSEEVSVGNVRKRRIRGMGSEGALRDNVASLTRYAANSDGIIVPEGVEGLVDISGPVSQTLGFAAIALRRSLSYHAAKDLVDFRKKARLIKSTPSGVVESRPHSITETGS